MRELKLKEMKFKFLLILFSGYLSFCQFNNDYFNYHKSINEAEKLFFLKKNIDSSLFVYEKAFNSVEKPFLSDIINASQIALYGKKNYKKFIVLGFRHGLRIEDLEKIKFFKNSKVELKNNDLINIYKKNRKEYLKNIDTKYLDIIYELAIKDQYFKVTLNESEYEREKEKLYKILIKNINERGFPGENKLGIASSTIFSELGIKRNDFDDRKKKFSANLDHFTSGEELISQKMAILFLIHNLCSYNDLETIWMKEIGNGNIHPREVALFYDNMYRAKNLCKIKKSDVPYKINLFVNYDEYTNKTKEINLKRNELFINSIEIDEIKHKYQKEFGFRFTYGFWGCR